MKNLMRLTKLDLFIKKKSTNIGNWWWFLKKIIFRAFETFFEFIYKKLTALPSIYKLQMRIVQTFEKKITAVLEIYKNEHLKV